IGARGPADPAVQEIQRVSWLKMVPAPPTPPQVLSWFPVATPREKLHGGKSQNVSPTRRPRRRSRQPRLHEVNSVSRGRSRHDETDRSFTRERSGGPRAGCGTWSGIATVLVDGSAHRFGIS